jgi:transglutaminase-like putative cysteine protease
VRRFGRRFSGDGRDIDVWEPSPLAAAGRRLAVIGVVVAVILPLAVPGMTTGLLDRFGTGVGDGSGVGNGPGRAGNVNLFSFLSGSLVRETSYDMVRVSTDDPSPFYLRFGVAEDLTSQGFVNRAWGQSTPLSRLEEPQRLAIPGVSYKSNAAVVEVLEFNERVLPLYEQVTKIDRLDGAWGFDRRSGVVYSGRNTAKGRKYVVHYTRPEYTPEALRTARDLNEGDQIRNSNIRKPEVAEIKDIAEKLVVGKNNQYDRVRAVYDFFAPTNGFKYSLETKAGNSGSAMVDFLREDNRQGYCEQYAAAMAWLLRAVNIPARVAFGFTKGNNRNGNTYTLSNFNLHAWTEVYFDGFGWVPFDATPPSGISGSVSSAWAPDPNQPTGTSGAAPSDDLVPGQNLSGSASAAATNPYGPNDPGITGGTSASENSSTWPWYLLGGAVVLLLLLVLPALRRVAVRRRRLAGTGASATGSASGPVPAGVAASVGVGPGGEVTGAQAAGLGRARRDAHAAWDELLDTMIDYRVEIDPAETPRLTGVRLITEARLPEAAAGGVQVLSRAEERARYARSPLTDVDLGGPLRDIRTALREGVSLRTRLQASLMPPSVLARWRTVSSARYLSFSTAAAHRREAMFRAVSPRRLLTRSR